MACASCGKKYVALPVVSQPVSQPSPVEQPAVSTGEPLPASNGFYRITPVKPPAAGGHQVGVPEEVAIADLIIKE